MADFVDRVLEKIEVLIREGRYEGLESDGLEIKPVPAAGQEWRERYKSANAFLNTRGGVILFGIREDGQGPQRRYIFTGYREEAEEKMKTFPAEFTDRHGTKLDLREAFPKIQLREFMGGRVAVMFIDELPSDRKFVFYRGEAWKRILTGDHKISETEIEGQEEFREEAWRARELQPVPDVSAADLNLDALNDYIQQLNRPVKVETIKPDLASAQGFLERKCFIKEGHVTTLGMLVCGSHPADTLGFRCHVHGYVDVPQEVAQDKQDLIGNILPLMQSSLAYLLRNIQIGVSAERGGIATPQYPEEVLRETVNNALAHRDYSINKQAIISIKPNEQISIRNPGRFRAPLLIEHPDDAVPLRRIIPEAKPRNPKLADVLRVYRKWEGKGIGMATLVNLALENRIDLPTYRIYGEEVCLILKAGPLMGESMKTMFAGFDAYIEQKNGGALTDEQALVIAYLMKSEEANRRQHYSILLTPDNNHFEQLLRLEQAGLIEKHERSSALYPVYLADRVLMQTDYRSELEALFRESLSTFDATTRDCLNVLYRHGEFSQTKQVTAKMAAFAIWYATKGVREDIREFDRFYRKIRHIFKKLEEAGYIVRSDGSSRLGYRLNSSYQPRELLVQ